MSRPDPPAGFTSTLVDVEGVALHVLEGGAGDAVLLVGGWPQTWFAWRDVMALLAHRRRVVVVEPRGTGGSDRPAGGYDAASIARELVAVMARLGHERFAMVGHDLGVWWSYAAAADHPDAVTHLVLVDSFLPGVGDGAPLVGAEDANRRLWHLAFNRLDAPFQRALLEGRERVFLGWQFANKAATPLAADVVDVYVDAYSRPGALVASFDYYRAVVETAGQNETRRRRPLGQPVFVVAGAGSAGPAMASALRPVAPDLTEHVLAGVGHYVPDEAGVPLAHLVDEFLTSRTVHQGETHV